MFVTTESGEKRFLVINQTALLEVDSTTGDTITSHYKR